MTMTRSTEGDWRAAADSSDIVVSYDSGDRGTAAAVDDNSVVAGGENVRIEAATSVTARYTGEQ